MQLRARGLDDEAPGSSGLTKKIAQDRVDGDQALIELLRQAADGCRAAIAGGVVVDIAVAEAAIKIAPLLIVDGRLKVSGRVCNSLDRQNNPELAFGCQRKTSLSCTAEQLKLNDRSFPVQTHGITLTHVWYASAVSILQSMSSSSLSPIRG